MFDTLVQGGNVVTPEGVLPADVGISGGKIAALVLREGTDASGLAKRLVDASGLLVLPGGIDPHVHCDWTSGSQDPEGPTGPEQVSRAALCGGTTTLIDFVHPHEGEHIRAATERTDGAWNGIAYCDYSQHVFFDGSATSETVTEVPRLLDDGFTSFKVFMTNVRPTVTGRRIDSGVLADLMVQVRDHGGIIAVHAEDDEIVMHNYRRLLAEGKDDFAYIHEVHSNLSEHLACNRVIDMAEFVGSVPLYIMHIGAKEGVAAIARGRDRGLPVYGETIPGYVLRTFEDYRQPDGQLYHTYPSLKSEADRQVVADAIVTGELDTLATDAVFRSLEEKLRGTSLTNVNGGSIGVETRVSLMYTEFVTKRGMSLERFADVISTNAAKVLGLYPQKGAIRVGSDADLCLLRTAETPTWDIRSEDLSESTYTPWEGHRVSARTEAVMLRGNLVVSDGRFAGEEPRGTRVVRSGMTAI